jgi:hypothetical protein
MYTGKFTCKFGSYVNYFTFDYLDEIIFKLVLNMAPIHWTLDYKLLSSLELCSSSWIKLNFMIELFMVVCTKK